MTAPVLTVIIVSWRVCDLLRDCLASLFSETDLGDGALDVIVVDNASGDGTIEMVRSEFPSVRLIASGKNLGFGRANTLAFEETNAPFVLLLNPDTLIQDRAVERLLAHLRARPDVAAAGCRLCNADGSLQRWTGGRFPTLGSVAAHYLFPASLLAWTGRDSSIYLTRDVAEDIDVDWVTGACLMLRRERVPPPLFDPVYWMYGEDIDLCHRIRAAGGRVIYTPIATVTHFQGASMKQQSGEVLLTSLKGMRTFYAHRAGRLRTYLFDTLTVTGFALRWAIYRCAVLVRRDPRLNERARSSAHNVRLALRLMMT
ncbi:glycosyltransferase family 2 protein [Methylobacterium currus]|uniref:Glycosyltransferase family 2 protein n=1 Tax=Methylobacterium currus TaxID=2051553 RepID=A0A2R4WQK6_9HYPH|nr:glycosyltransferase family 2 protein [Methylobacterium currus]AWB23808.1 glycosyltransferase family 2 protein [Methylobacterium currus]